MAIDMPAPHPNDILVGPWGMKHRGEFEDPNYQCDIPECGCHEKGTTMTTAVQDDGATAIARERARQQTVEGYTAEHDARHGAKQLIDAALAYTVQAQDKITEAAGEGVGADGPDKYWPWDWSTFRPNDDELRSLAKAGALLAAAYDAALACRG